jgi:hypothetical protein
VEHDDVDTWAPLARVKAKITAPTPVLRAASAEITAVFVTDETHGAEVARQLARRLKWGLGVEATIGYPEYSAEDWDARPEWMRVDPWRSTYHVDEMMAGFTRDGYR